MLASAMLTTQRVGPLLFAGEAATFVNSNCAASFPRFSDARFDNLDDRSGGSRLGLRQPVTNSKNLHDRSGDLRLGLRQPVQV